MAGRRTARIVSASVLVSALTFGPSTAPAQAGLLGDLLGVVGGVVSTTTGLVTGTVSSLLGPTGWMYDETTADLDHVSAVVGADRMRARGYTGRGIGVAIVDTGVVPVDGLRSGNVVNGPDLSFESQSDEHRYLDTFGHGTHLAGIIAGDEPATLLGGSDRFQGIAPDVRLTSLKVASTEGAVDVSQVIAAIDWVVAHRNDDPRHPIRVLNLSYGTDGTQHYRLDPLTHAVENAWRAGIVVVVAGGNSGTDAPQLNNPAYDPYVLAVGASDTRGTVDASDDLVPEFSSRGSWNRRVDLVAPGRSILSLRDPGSYLDEAHPGARVGERYFKGSGSSQAAAVVSGAVALLLDARPSLTPDQVKALLESSAEPMRQADAAGRGAGELDVFRAYLRSTPSVRQDFPRSTGLGSLEEARGTQHVASDGVELTGEQHVLGAFSARRWAPASAAFSAWSGGTWAGGDFTGECWCASTWAGRAWAGRAWAGDTWSGKAWAGSSWNGRAWAGRAWAGDAWAGKAWAGSSWVGKAWAGRAWAAASPPPTGTPPDRGPAP
jgi:serine protease AprX